MISFILTLAQAAQAMPGNLFYMLGLQCITRKPEQIHAQDAIDAVRQGIDKSELHAHPCFLQPLVFLQKLRTSLACSMYLPDLSFMTVPGDQLGTHRKLLLLLSDTMLA